MRVMQLTRISSWVAEIANRSPWWETWERLWQEIMLATRLDNTKDQVTATFLSSDHPPLEAAGGGLASLSASSFS
jgi:hypothetical protein